MNENKEITQSSKVEEVSVPAEWLLAVPHVLGALSIITPFLGFLAPLFYWLAKKDDDPGAEREGRKVLNFQIIYLILSLGVTALVMALPYSQYAAAADVIMAVVYFKAALGFCVAGLCSLGAYKTSKGADYKYPVSINVIRKPVK